MNALCLPVNIGRSFSFLYYICFMIFKRHFAIRESRVSKTHPVAAEYSSDVVQILDRVRMVDLCQPATGLSTMRRVRVHLSSEGCLPILESCHVGPLPKLELVHFFFFWCGIFIQGSAVREVRTQWLLTK